VKRTPDEGAILAAVARMPYGGLVDFRIADGPVTLATVARYMDALAEVLTDTAERSRSEHAELLRIRRDVEGMRRLLGIGGAS
jgi:hypothetical protein